MILHDTPPHTKLTQVPHACALVLSTPRTASIVVSEVLYCHWQKYYPRTQHLGEFLNPYHFNLHFEKLPDGTKLNHQEYAPGRFKTIPSIDGNGRIIYADIDTPQKVDHEQEIDRRIFLLKNATTSFILHHHVFTEELVDKILQARFHKVILCRRENTWDQMLSYGIALHLKRFKWVADSEFTLKPESVEFRKEDFDRLASRIRLMNRLAEREDIKQLAQTVWHHEVMREDDTFNVLTHMDLPKTYVEPRFPISVRTPYSEIPVVYYTEKNYNELRGWYQDAGI